VPTNAKSVVIIRAITSGDREGYCADKSGRFKPNAAGVTVKMRETVIKSARNRRQIGRGDGP
jgi:hypothetical protein